MTIVSCSAISPVKRVGLLLRALRELSRSAPVQWIHFGDGPLRGQLESEIDALADDRLQVDLRGQTANSDVMAFYLATPVDVFVNVSDSEGVPVSIMEAMSVGIPIVATDVGGVSEVVGVGKGSGTLIDAAASADEIAEAIRRTAEMRDLDPRATWEEFSNANENADILLKELDA